MLTTRKSTPSNTVASATSDYAVDSARPYGPVWKARRPPGLPESARPCSAPRAALDHVRSHAESKGLGLVFVSTMTELSMGESGAQYGRPANNFDARLMQGYSATEAARRFLVPFPNGPRRPRRKKLVTAWGVFQWNRDAGRDTLRDLPANWFAWDWSPAEEVERPIDWYAQVFRRALSLGASQEHAARAVRLWHAEPATYNRYIDRGPRLGWDTAWRQVGIAKRIDKHLDRAGVLA